MKKLFLIFTILLFASCVQAADWSVTVTWTRSVGPNLASEEVFLDTVSKCTVLPAAPTTCQFVVSALSGQLIKIKSINTQGAFSETTPIALNPVPAPATGVMLNITYVAP